MKWSVDKSLLLVIVFFFGLGLIQIYSSSYIFAAEKYNSGIYFFSRQLIFTILGITILLTVLFTPWKFIEKWGFLIWVIAALGVLLTFVPDLSIKVNGAARWLRLPFGQRIEPSEILKMSYPLLLSVFLAKNLDWGKYKVIIKGIIVLTPLVLLLKQPDFGSFIICVLLIGFLLFAFGLKWRYLFLGSLALLPGVYYLVRYETYRYNRLLAFINPWSDPEQKGFQLIQSLLGFYSGGVFGKGLGQAQSKLFFLPEAHTDFTLSVLGEEMGFVGFFAVACLYGFIIFRGIQITLRAREKSQKIVALGATLIFSFSTLINMGVVLGLTPTKGLALPFLSYGGSSLIAVCFGLGLLLNIDRQTRMLKSKRYFQRV